LECLFMKHFLFLFSSSEAPKPGLVVLYITHPDYYIFNIADWYYTAFCIRISHYEATK
jgi:hypothetical protein